MESMTIGQRIALKRKELGLSQIGLGELMGVSRQSISKWEADAAIPEIDKLIALSRLFKVSVGWLLGVEEEPRSDEPEEDVAQREQLLIDQLTQPRTGLPRWLKPVVLAAAALSVVGVILGGAALYRAESHKKDVAAISQALAQLPGLWNSLTGEQLEEFSLLVGAYTDMGDVGVQLVDYGFLIEPRADPEQVDVVFTAQPSAYLPDVKAELLIQWGEEALLRAPCEWTGSEYYLRFPLEARDGCAVSLLLTSQDGITKTIPLTDLAMTNLKSAGTFGFVRVGFEDFSYQDGTLTLDQLHFYIDLPMTYRDLSDPWTQCDLVVLADGEEVGRLDMLNRSQYSRQVNFMAPDLVDFTSQRQSIAVGELAEGTDVELRLEGSFTTGLDLMKIIETWTVRQGKLTEG